MEELLSSDAAVHEETLKLLAETAEYLGRLPLNHVTLKLKSRIDAHLQRPGAKAHADRLASIAKDMEWRNRLEAGTCFSGVTKFTEDGTPELECLVMRGNVYFQSPAYEAAQLSGNEEAMKQMALGIGQDIAVGTRIILQSPDGLSKERMLKRWQNARN